MCEQAGTEVDQAQFKLGMDFTLIFVDLIFIDLVCQNWLNGFCFVSFIEKIWFGVFSCDPRRFVEENIDPPKSPKKFG